MTKKSDSRLLRDAKKAHAQQHLETNTCWDELNAMYSDMCQLLATHTHLSAQAKNTELIAAVVDKATLVSNIRCLANDLKTLNDELIKIHSEHAGKTGGSRNPDDIIGTITIFEKYNLFMERHDAVVMPTAYHIIEQFAQAENILIAKAKADLLNPAVVSDAIIVDPKDTTVMPATTEVVETTLGSVTTPIGVPAPDFAKLQESFTKLQAAGLAEIKIPENVTTGEAK